MQYHCFQSTVSAQQNASLLQDYLALKDTEKARKTHLFEGRYENIYLDRGVIPAVLPVLEQAVGNAREVLGIEPIPQVGFWFNEMLPGQRTLPHTHDDDDELLSGVYYVTVPEQSGHLLLGSSADQVRITPKEGMFVFFKPSLIHEVEPNCSPIMRLSIGMNFGIRVE